MTALRLIPLQAHGALELLVGLAAMVAPFAVGFDAAGTVLSVVVGATLVGLALGSTTDERGVPAVPVATHHAIDYGLAIGVGASALLLAIAGDPLAGATLAGLAAVQLLLNLSTRYTARA